MEALAPYYLYIKFVHVFFVMMWAMSALGAYVFYLRSTIYQLEENPGDEKLEERLNWAYEQFDKTVILEHIAFPIVLLTGMMLFYATGWALETPWLFVKLVIVVGFFIPLEILDFWIAHVWGARVTRGREEDPWAWAAMRSVHWKFLKTTAPMVRYSVPVVIFLAVVKPSLW
jgi:uncharacterized membrane protein